MSAKMSFVEYRSMRGVHVPKEFDRFHCFVTVIVKS